VNLVEYIEYGKDIKSDNKNLNGKNYLALELAENGSLLNYFLSKKDKNFSEKWLRYWFKQVLRGLIHI
jgi:serine/threonine protein kinase